MRMSESKRMSLLLLVATLSVSTAFIPLHHTPRTVPSRQGLQSTPKEEDVSEATSLQPVFDFRDSSTNETDRFERIDDVIMGGISTSTLRQVDGEPFARWSGVCREDGGGFCGMRTLPFQEALEVSDDAEGLFLTCRLSSDDEPDRRSWKISTRTEKSRGEQLYQALFQIPPSEEEDWKTIQIPFDEFRLVRGARLVPNGPPLNTTGGLFQIGMTLSKFGIGENMTSISNFRSGFFELQIQQIGLYNNNVNNNNPQKQTVVASLTKEEAMAQRPLVLKLLLPLSVIAFTEKSQRRKSAMRLLREKRGLTRRQAILFGLRWRAKQLGILQSVAKTVSILLADSARQATRSVLRYGLFVPLRVVFRTFQRIGRLFSKRKDDKAESSV